MANILPFNLFHRTTTDTKCGKHRIPENTLVQAMIHTVLSEDPLFDDSDTFRPERFLMEDGRTFRKVLTILI